MKEFSVWSLECRGVQSEIGMVRVPSPVCAPVLPTTWLDTQPFQSHNCGLFVSGLLKQVFDGYLHSNSTAISKLKEELDMLLFAYSGGAKQESLRDLHDPMSLFGRSCLECLLSSCMSCSPVCLKVRMAASAVSHQELVSSAFKQRSPPRFQQQQNPSNNNPGVCAVKKYRAQKKAVEKELRDLTVEHELRLQAFQKLQEERNDLLKRQRESILDIQQRSGLKKILLQKKLAAVTETLEKKEAQLCAALSVCSIEPTVCSNAVSKLEEILESKRTSMDALQQDLDLECQEYEQVRHSWKEQLKASGGSLHDFPFRPAKKILKDAGSDQ
ncbi:hypothetical protein CRENBAI_007102 [Crenichthys baileyi]|uniref:Dynein regulatory complex subunit 4 n=1 Tax=Crenichthys baileyi TaxID=28760 RepID=A0AAV9S7W7_9TELE